MIFWDICYVSVSVSDLFFLRTRSHTLWFTDLLEGERLKGRDIGGVLSL